MSIRIPLAFLGETRPQHLKTLKISNPPDWRDIQRNKQYGTPLPDTSVECFRENKAEGFLDVPFHYGKTFYNKGNMFTSVKGNMNIFMDKPIYESKFIGQPRERQVSFLSESLQKLEDTDQVLLSAHPGFGKTFSAIYLAVKMKKYAIIVVNRRPLLKQWKESIKSFTNGGVWVYGDPLPDKPVQFLVCMIGVLQKLPTSYKDKFGTLILDEAHMLATCTQVPEILTIHPHKLILCTATPDRDVRTSHIIYTFIGNERVERKYNGFLQVIKFHTGIEKVIQVQKDGRTPNYSDYTKQLALDNNRNNMMVQWVLKNKDRKMMILTPGQEHTKDMTKLLKSRGVSCDFYSGNKKSYQEAKVLIGTFAKIGVGFDPAANEEWDGFHYDTLIMMGTTRSLSLIEQLWGRTFRSKKPSVVIFIDDMKIAENHFKEMKKIAKIYKAKMVETDQTLDLESTETS